MRGRTIKSKFTLGFSLCLLAGLSGCQTTPVADDTIFLSDSDWTLIEYGTGEHDAGLIEAPFNRYTMHLEADGSATFRLDCNRAIGSWQAAGSLSSGRLSFGPVSSTQAFCGDEAIDQELAASLQQVSNYAQYDGRLTMSLAENDTIYVWDRID